MSYRLPTIWEFKDQFVRDFPYATPLAQNGQVAATGTATLANGSVASISVNSGGSGLGSTSLAVILYGGGGVGAAGIATLTAGAVTSIAVSNPGYGYAEAPQVFIPLNAGDNTLVTKVTDYDITRAFNAATSFNLTQRIFGSQAAFSYAVNLLSAHYLVQTVQAGEDGLGGKAEWLTASKTVGKIGEAFAIPERILRSPYLSKLSKTTYGAQFLELISPSLIGNVSVLCGTTQP